MSVKKGCTGGPLLTWFFETLEKQPCKQRTKWTKKPCCFENRVVRESCKWRTDCISEIRKGALWSLCKLDFQNLSNFWKSTSGLLCPTVCLLLSWKLGSGRKVSLNRLCGQDGSHITNRGESKTHPLERSVGG